MSNMFWYFGYGSNMNLSSLRAKGVVPRMSERAVLSGWRLRFNVGHFFRHEGGVANIEPTGEAPDAVWGVVHLCEDEHLALLDGAEAQGHGYDRVEVSVHTNHGGQRAITYVGMPSFLDEGCRPTQRYLNILLKGADAAGLDPSYIDALRRHPVHHKQSAPPFVPPPGKYRTFTAMTLTQTPPLTALAGHVFDMSGARWHHNFLQGFFGGKDMTLFHLMRLDASDGSETLDDIKHDRLTPAQREYLNEYLHAYNTEYVYVGRYLYD
jgi:sulfite reductase (NADPH) flavoprotein alpha-component